MTNNINITINVPVSWSDEKKRFGQLDVQGLIKMMQEVPVMRKYCEMDTPDRTDEKATPLVISILVEMVRLLHQDPQYRNVFLHPGKPSQALVYVSDKEKIGWESVPFDSVVRTLFEGVSGQIWSVIERNLGRSDLIPFDVMGGASSVKLCFNGNREKYFEGGKKPVAEHLTELRAETPGAPVAPTCVKIPGARLSPFSAPAEAAPKAESPPKETKAESPPKAGPPSKAEAAPKEAKSTAPAPKAAPKKEAKKPAKLSKQDVLPALLGIGEKVTAQMVDSTYAVRILTLIARRAGLTAADVREDADTCPRICTKIIEATFGDEGPENAGTAISALSEQQSGVARRIVEVFEGDAKNEGRLAEALARAR